MLGQKRTVYDFLEEIVEACREPIIFINLFYKMRTTYAILKKNLDIALRFGLIENPGEKYHTTQKGKGFLDAWAKVQTFLKEESQI